MSVQFDAASGKVAVFGVSNPIGTVKNVSLEGRALFDAGGSFPLVSATEKQNQDLAFDRHETL